MTSTILDPTLGKAPRPWPPAAPLDSPGARLVPDPLHELFLGLGIQQWKSLIQTGPTSMLNQRRDFKIWENSEIYQLNSADESKGFQEYRLPNWKRETHLETASSWAQPLQAGVTTWRFWVLVERMTILRYLHNGLGNRLGRSSWS
jgi:hypothetical protein